MFGAPTHDGAGWGDYGQMVELLEDVDDDTSRVLRHAGHKKAREFLTTQTDKVLRIAKALLANHRIADDELTGLLN